MWPPEQKTDKQLLRELKEQVARIKGGDLDIRRAALESIYELSYANPGRIGYAITTLIECLADPDEKISEGLCYALSYAAPDSIAPTAARLTDSNPLVRDRAAHALGLMGERALGAAFPLRALLADQVAAVRQRAAWSIGLIRDSTQETIAALTELVKSADAKDRSSSLHALGNIGSHVEERSVLLDCCGVVEASPHDADEGVRCSALYAFASLPVSQDIYVQTLVGMLRSDESERVLESIVSDLKKLAPTVELEACVPRVCELLGRSKAMRRSCAELLSEMRPAPTQCLPNLCDALKDREVVVSLCRAIWKISGTFDDRLVSALEVDVDESVCDLVSEVGPAAKSLMPQLLEALATDYWDLQWAAADAVGAIASPDPEVIDALMSALSHDSPIVKSAAARALGRIGSPAIARLLGVLEDLSDKRRSWAAFAIQKMGIAGASAVATLRKHQDDRNPAVANSCAIAVAICGADSSVLPRLIQIAESGEDVQVRVAAIQAVASLGPSGVTAQASLRELSRNKDGEIADAACNALTAVETLAS
jgi:HEAT repeat protein